MTLSFRRSASANSLTVPAGAEGRAELDISEPGSLTEISLGAGAKVSVLLRHSAGGKLSVSLGEGACLELAELKDPGAQDAEFETSISCSAGSVFRGVNAIVSGGKVSEERRIVMAGRGSDARQGEIFYCRGKERLASDLLIIHKVPETTAFASSRGLLSGGGSARSRGLVRIERPAQKTDSFLSQHAILLDSDSKNESLPSLEIEANDVKASHSASSGPIDAEQVFYLQARGIGREAAVRMIALGFLLPELKGFSAAAEVGKAFEEKWEGKG